jgi:hypothetical protein
MKVSRVLQRAVRYFNPLMKFVLATRLHTLMSGRLALLSFTGRKSGRSFTTPVSYVMEGRTLLVPGGGAWWKNLGSGRAARVRLRGVWTPVSSEIVSEPVALAEVVRKMLAANPAIAAFTGVKPGPDGWPDADALERERQRGFVVARLRLQDTPSSG